MIFSEESIARFQDLYKAHFGKELSKAEAYEKAAQLMRLIRALTDAKKEARDKSPTPAVGVSNINGGKL